MERAIQIEINTKQKNLKEGKKTLGGSYLFWITLTQLFFYLNYVAVLFFLNIQH